MKIPTMIAIAMNVKFRKISMNPPISFLLVYLNGAFCNTFSLNFINLKSTYVVIGIKNTIHGLSSNVIQTVR